MPLRTMSPHTIFAGVVDDDEVTPFHECGRARLQHRRTKRCEGDEN